MSWLVGSLGLESRGWSWSWSWSCGGWLGVIEMRILDFWISGELGVLG